MRRALDILDQFPSDHPEPRVRKNLCFAYGELLRGTRDHEDAAERLASFAVADRSIEVRQAALDQLGLVDRPEAQQAVLGALTRRFESDNQLAAIAYAAFDQLRTRYRRGAPRSPVPNPLRAWLAHTLRGWRRNGAAEPAPAGLAEAPAGRWAFGTPVGFRRPSLWRRLVLATRHQRELLKHGRALFGLAPTAATTAVVLVAILVGIFVTPAIPTRETVYLLGLALACGVLLGWAVAGVARPIAAMVDRGVSIPFNTALLCGIVLLIPATVSLASGINPWLGTVEDPAYIAHELFAIGALILTLLLQRPLAVWLATREPERESRRWELFCCASLGLVWFTALMVSGERMRWYSHPEVALGWLLLLPSAASLSVGLLLAEQQPNIERLTPAPDPELNPARLPVVTGAVFAAAGAAPLVTRFRPRMPSSQTWRALGRGLVYSMALLPPLAALSILGFKLGLLAERVLTRPLLPPGVPVEEALGQVLVPVGVPIAFRGADIGDGERHLFRIELTTPTPDLELTVLDERYNPVGVGDASRRFLFAEPGVDYQVIAQPTGTTLRPAIREREVLASGSEGLMEPLREELGRDALQLRQAPIDAPIRLVTAAPSTLSIMTPDEGVMGDFVVGLFDAHGQRLAFADDPPEIEQAVDRGVHYMVFRRWAGELRNSQSLAAFMRPQDTTAGQQPPGAAAPSYRAERRPCEAGFCIRIGVRGADADPETEGAAALPTDGPHSFNLHLLPPSDWLMSLPIGREIGFVLDAPAPYRLNLEPGGLAAPFGYSPANSLGYSIRREDTGDILFSTTGAAFPFERTSAADIFVTQAQQPVPQNKILEPAGYTLLIDHVAGLTGTCRPSDGWAGCGASQVLKAFQGSPMDDQGLVPQQLAGALPRTGATDSEGTRGKSGWMRVREAALPPSSVLLTVSEAFGPERRAAYASAENAFFGAVDLAALARTRHHSPAQLSAQRHYLVRLPRNQPVPLGLESESLLVAGADEQGRDLTIGLFDEQAQKLSFADDPALIVSRLPSGRYYLLAAAFDDNPPELSPDTLRIAGKIERIAPREVPGALRASLHSALNAIALGTGAESRSDPDEDLHASEDAGADRIAVEIIGSGVY